MMKRMSYGAVVACALLFVGTFLAQEAPVKTLSFTLDNGARVLLQPADHNDIVAVQALIFGGSANITKHTSGIEALWLSSAQRAGKHYPREILVPKLEYLGAAMDWDADKDQSSFMLQCLRSTFDESMDIFLDLLLHPALNPEDVELMRSRLIASFQKKMESPDGLLSYTFNTAYYHRHPYCNLAGGTSESLRGISVQDITAHMQKVLTGKNLLFVVVGNVDPEALRTRLNKTVGALPAGINRLSKNVPFTPPEGTVAVTVEKPLPTTYLLGKFQAPSPDHPDYFAFELGLSILSRQLWDAVRTQQGLAYAVTSGMAAYRSNYGYFYLSSNEPGKAVAIMRATVKKAMEEGFSAEQVQAGKAVYTTRYFMQLEANMDQAGIMAWSDMYLGGWKGADALLTPLKDLTPEQLRTVMRTWLRGIHWGWLGRSEGVDSKAFFESP